MLSAASAGNGEPPNAFPPTAVFRTFLSTVSDLAAASVADRDAVWERLGDHDRSQVQRAMTALGLRSPAGEVDELALRRLADPAHRAEALAHLLERHYGPQLEMVRSGVDRPTLERSLAVPGRSSPSSLEKARQFFENALALAGIDSSGIRRGRRKVQRSDEPDRRDGASRSIAIKYEGFADQLLARHERLTGRGESDPELEERIERVLGQLATLLAD